jgi:hypothetical protein
MNLRIRFSAPRSGRVWIKAHDITGRPAVSILNENVEPGLHGVIGRGIDDNRCKLSSGLYFLRAGYEKETFIRKVNLIAE